jgi:hypothetical protein
MKIGLIAGVAGLATSAAALANPGFADYRAMGANDLPVNPHQLRNEAPAAAGVVIDLGTGLSVARPSVNGSPRGTVLTCTDNLNNLTPFPTPLNNQLGNAVWSDGSITGVNRWLGTTVAGRTTFASTLDVGGNATAKTRLMATTAFGPDLFFFGFRYEFLRTNSPLVRVGFEPAADQVLQLDHDMYVTSIGTMWTSEPIYVTSGFITSRLLWGGTCVASCPDIGLPTGPLPGVYTLGVNPNSFLTGIFRTCVWLEGPLNGQDVVMLTGAWIRVRHQHVANGDIEHYLNYNDGNGFNKCYDEPFITGLRCDSLGGNGSFELIDDPTYYDNISIIGVEVVLPSPPTELECGPSGYSEDMEWLNTGPLKDQNQVWFDALSSKANVDLVSGDKVIRQTNFFADDRHREEFTRTLPEVTATPGNPWTLCEEVRMNGGLQASNQTVRAFGLVSILDNSFTTRMAYGHFDPMASPPYKGRVFVQHNAAYNPIDDEDCVDCYIAGPNGNGAVPRIGGAGTIGDPNFDYYDSGTSLGSNNVARIWCIEVSEDNSMAITFNNTSIVGGGSGVNLPAFVHSLNELRHESENQSGPGETNNIFVDDINLSCQALPAVTPPPLTLVYGDDFEVYNLNVTIDANDDDGNPVTPFRWASAPNIPVVDIGLEGGQDQVLRMENLFQDTAQVQGDFTLFTQASTQLPNVTVSSSRGYAAGGDFMFTDFLTTRAWVVAEADIVPGLFNTNAWLLFSAGTGTMWYLEPDAIDPINNDPVWVDTGVSVAALGINADEWFSLSIHRNLNGTFLFKINAVTLRDSGNAIVHTDPLQSDDAGIHENLDRLFLLSGDDENVGDGSILYADNIRAWALPCNGDTNDDGFVVFADLNDVLGSYNGTVQPGFPPNFGPDADGDGVADDSTIDFGGELNPLLGQYNQPCD